MEQTRRWGIAVVVVAVQAGLLSTGRAQDPVPRHSVQRFEELKDSWKLFANSDVTLRIEGRTAAVSPSLLRFRGSGIPFRPADGVELPSGAGNVMEVTGRLERRDGRWEFLVEKWKRLPADVERFRLERNRLPQDDPRPWYRLAEWATRRAKFYDDDRLRRQAEDARRQGIRVEHDQLEDGDVEGLLALADKAARLDVPAVRLEFLHEAYHLQWREMRDREQPQVSELAEQVARTLPGCRLALSSPETELQQRYWKTPLLVYQAADRAQRRKLHRIFYTELAVAAIEQKASSEAEDGFAIARRIDERFPERHALAEAYRDRALDSQLERVEELTRDELATLTEQLRQRNRSEDATGAVNRWLEAEIKRARRSGAGELVEAAQACLDLRDDRPRAVRLLKEAWDKSPGLEPAADQLERLGYRWHEGEWRTEQEIASRPPDPVEQAMREGRVIEGMTPGQVRNALGAPTSVMQIATAGQVNVVWQYGDRGSAPLVVHFLRRSSQPASQSEVVKFFQLDSRR